MQRDRDETRAFFHRFVNARVRKRDTQDMDFQSMICRSDIFFEINFHLNVRERNSDNWSRVVHRSLCRTTALIIIP